LCQRRREGGDLRACPGFWGIGVQQCFDQDGVSVREAVLRHHGNLPGQHCLYGAALDSHPAARREVGQVHALVRVI